MFAMVLSAPKAGLRWLLLILLFLGVLLFAASWGAPVPFSDIWSHDPQAAEIARRIFWWSGGEPGIRPTRVCAGVLVGASLAVSGATLQNVFKNPLAEPYLLGISAGGALGAALSKVLPEISIGAFDSTTLLAFVGALASSLAIYVLGKAVAKGSFSFDRARLLLTGVALSAFLSALMSLVVAISARADLARQITFWLLGGLGEATPQHNLALALCLLAGLGVLLASARDLNASRLGDEDAASLGVDIPKLHARLLLVASLLSAAAVAAAGLIGFVGLLGPHLVRMLFGSDARRLIPASALGGATLLVLCDALARGVLPPQELPVGVVTALLGVPLFLFVARNQL
jgi:iron complex transport system permease protein